MWILRILLAMFALVGCASSKVDHEPPKDVLMKSVMISIEGMHCDSCAERIEKNLERIDGVLDATLSFDDKRAVIQYDAHKLEPKRLASAISDLGFKAGVPVEAKP